MPLTDEQRRRRQELERELADLRAQDDERPLTIAEVKAMSREEVEREWERVKRTLASAPEPGRPEPSGVQRLASAQRRSEYPDTGGQGDRGRLVSDPNEGGGDGE